ncbi:putative shc transforming protein [Schistosoma mansoni]|uniref:putative shc transforming protein n=1 Tax=Schistosoma mansoni TaxID=6183 RepID=UPI00022DC7D6|nr:putative shc transforming protein [Schistosoma mansoni]|eukprot:XP_018649178.1 putative shc transforming protein [Schistosoma mansoni]
MSIEPQRSQQWLHHDSQLAADAGVTFELQYVGAIPVLTSIKSVNINIRTRICRASIRRVCEDVGLKLPSNRSADKSIEQFIGPSTDMTWAIVNVYLTITSQTLTVETIDNGVLLFQHNLFLVSFASAGDADTPDFICYVAKTDQDTRMCYVFECSDGLAQDVIITIGQAFQLGYQVNINTNSHLQIVMEVSANTATSLSKENTALSQNTSMPNNNVTHQPVAFDNFMGHLGNEISSDNQTDSAEYNKPSCGTKKSSAQSNQNELTQELSQQPSRKINKVAGVKSISNIKAPVGLPNFEHLEPVGEPWYVGKMSRSQAENLLRYDGDFLVRASIQQPGQFVLSGLQDGKYRHLLLADPNGKVRTKERVFDSIQHLIDYHVQNGAPIRSLDSEIRLIFPVSTHTFCIS